MSKNPVDSHLELVRQTIEETQKLISELQSRVLSDHDRMVLAAAEIARMQMFLKSIGDSTPDIPRKHL